MSLWRPAAIGDRPKIIAFVAKDGVGAAIELSDLLIKKATQLDQYSMQGRIGRVKGTRELVVYPKYILIYRITKKTVEILRVKHVAQHWPT